MGGIPLLFQGAGSSEVHEEFNPAVTIAWNKLHCLIKLWLVISILTLPIAMSVFYSAFGSIVGMVGAFVYLCGCCKGGIHGVTRSRVNVLKVTSILFCVLTTS